jgi:hypothetical protein
MERNRAYAYHDRALQRLRSLALANRAATMTSLETYADAKASIPPTVRIGVAVEESEGEARVGLRVMSHDEPTRLAIDAMKANGDIPEDVEVHEVGRLIGFGAADLVSPLLAGVSCGNIDGPRGTLGCFVKRDGATLLLSVNHVLALENHAAPESEILQPAAGATPRQTIGTLLDYEPLQETGNRMDGAIAKLTLDDAHVDFRLFNGKHITEVRVAPLDDTVRVFKFGQASDGRAGRILAASVSNITLEMDFTHHTFDQQIEIVPDEGGEAFAVPGDSGALVYDEDDRAVGLVVGGNGIDRTYVTPIALLLDRFNAVLA